jgi:hypothetical protein
MSTVGEDEYGKPKRFTVIIRATGNAIYNGNWPLSGTYAAKISPQEFSVFESAINSVRFEELRPYYGEAVPFYRIIKVVSGGNAKIVCDYGGEPAGLRKLENVVGDFIWKPRWNRIKDVPFTSIPKPEGYSAPPPEDMH